MIQEFETPSRFLPQLGSFTLQTDITLSNHFKRTILRNFVLLLAIYQSYFYRNYETIMYLRYLFYMKSPKLPAFTDNAYQYEHRDWISTFYESQEHIETYLPNYTSESSKRIAKIVHMQVFPFHPETKALTPTAVLFDYQREI